MGVDGVPVLLQVADGVAHRVGVLAHQEALAGGVEGVLGGLVFAVLGMILYCIVLSVAFQCRVNYLFAVVYGLVGSVAGVFGDLCFSVIKRQTGIKDYGNLMPGHGGALDRFDSMHVVAPLIELLLMVLPVVVK